MELCHACRERTDKRCPRCEIPHCDAHEALCDKCEADFQHRMKDEIAAQGEKTHDVSHFFMTAPIWAAACFVCLYSVAAGLGLAMLAATLSHVLPPSKRGAERRLRQMRRHFLKGPRGKRLAP